MIFRRHETEYQSLIEAAVFPIGVAPTAIFVAVCLGAIEVGYAVYLRPECLRGNGVVKAFAVKTAVCLQRTEGLVYVFGNKVIIAAVGAIGLGGEKVLTGCISSVFAGCSAQDGATEKTVIKAHVRVFSFIS
ncbi:hypothetical protein M733_00140 [Neisseria gonorrhoeae ATL_2011_05-13]|nr:hypothetical protein M685_06925 [Neisseria gonorrhoeae SK16259]KLS26441.1 hypothetical protein M733_00140 [Neisseria gonorrhoeae ATL_2011_05-13]